MTSYYVATYDHKCVIGIFEDKAQAKCACQVEVVKRLGWNDRDKVDMFTSIDKVEVNTFDYAKMWDSIVKAMKMR